jgi:bifunctional non-homologous end joining protein LigD
MATAEITVAGVRLTSPDRVLYEEQGITKKDLAEYYHRIERWIVPELRDRPLTLLRCPAGSEKECFIQRRASDAVDSSVRRVTVDVDDDDAAVEHLAVDSLRGLLSLVQLGVLELHTWGARRDRLDRPDRLVMDLDPAPDVPFTTVMEAAAEMRDTLAEYGLSSFVKTTGGKGLHVVAPLVRRNSWEALRGAARALAETVAERSPDRYLIKASKAERRGRIFIDWLRNGAGSTSIASYSTRARPGAPVSVPLAWDELRPDLDPARWTVLNVPGRLESLRRDPWEGFAGLRQWLTRDALDRLS